MTAEALVCRLFLESYQDGQIVEAQRFLSEAPPQASNEDFYYWYYGTLALFQTQGEAWENWNQQLQRHLLARQRTDGALAGSWDPDSKWGSYGGRVFSTALGALCLRHAPARVPLGNDLIGNRGTHKGDDCGDRSPSTNRCRLECRLGTHESAEWRQPTQCAGGRRTQRGRRHRTPRCTVPTDERHRGTQDGNHSQ